MKKTGKGLPMSGVNLEALRLDTIGKLDVRLEGLFAKHVQRACEDCINRPGDKSKRKVVLEAIIEPVPDPDDGTLDFSNVTFEVQSKVPVYRSKTYPMQTTKAGLKFNSDVPENLRQPALDFDEDERSR